MSDETSRRAAFIQSLLDCAAFLESHPDVQAPRYVTMHIFANSREEVASHARAATWEKVYNEDWFSLHKSFGEDLSLDVATSRDLVCERRVVGQRTIPAQPERTVDVVEWDCGDALLEGR